MRVVAFYEKHAPSRSMTANPAGKTDPPGLRRTVGPSAVSFNYPRQDAVLPGPRSRQQVLLSDARCYWLQIGED